MVEALVAMDPMRERMIDYDASELTCVFCGVDAPEHGPPIHRGSCLWHKARLWLSHHSPRERETSGHGATQAARPHQLPGSEASVADPSGIQPEGSAARHAEGPARAAPGDPPGPTAR
jgi:hypothetical protein